MRSHCVLSFLTGHAPAAFANHARYADTHGYRHVCVDASDGPRSAQVQTLHRYEALLRALDGCPADGIVLLLGEDGLVVEPHALDRLMAGRDALLVGVEKGRPQTDVQFWRNTPATRERIYRIMQRCRLGGEPFVDAATVLGDEPVHPWHERIDDLYAVMHAGANIDPYWRRAATFALSLGDLHDSPSEASAAPRIREILCAHLEMSGLRGLAPFSFETPAVDASADRSTYAPHNAPQNAPGNVSARDVAFVMLYTPGIAGYGGIAESNLRQYCERHGYTFYVYRDTPAEIGLSGTGNWFKPWLLDAYLPHHEWVIWVDADVLILDHERPIDDLLRGRDRLLARDIGQWPFNSGVMGFRRTEGNAAMLRGLKARIRGLADRSSVYAHNGDQFYFIEAMKQSGLLDEADILSPLVINTPWFMVGPDSFIAHYYGMWTEMRTLVMAYDEARRLVRDSQRQEK
ncbi:galactosyl transferase GMA12/MNN10 domain protein [Paraburkholderia sp. Ac-20336]|uniref:galactosyl transferase GMA12/MNN10 domain protein n=1 Tax=Paraburkholderia sp. Ac-20336 TaxID=2703886 RepID=UPI00197F41A9|nr:galactosyl transferase GMA12/MNN10 domain protein [Paraburkholderia sp. Ac-20336]MBN3807162.1 galactosyl transferase GMA12/MNN10 domain protein [Paraburkholderia sp. Ac-20336]